jgi:hypothetical protein
MAVTQLPSAELPDKIKARAEEGAGIVESKADGKLTHW